MVLLQRFFSVLTVLVLLTAINGCSFSESSKSSSKSSAASFESSSNIISSPFTSSSASSSKGESSYQDEVADYTSAYVKSSTGDVAAFQQGIADIANRNGVVNWQEDRKTYIAIGRGLKKANVKGVEYETFKKNFAGSDYGKMQDIQKGYESE